MTDSDRPGEVEVSKHAEVVEGRMGELIARYGDRFSPGETERIRASIGRNVAMAVTLRSVRLSNADEPGVVFVPDAFRATAEG